MAGARRVLSFYVPKILSNPRAFQHDECQRAPPRTRVSVHQFYDFEEGQHTKESVRMTRSRVIDCLGRTRIVLDDGAALHIGWDVKVCKSSSRSHWFMYEPPMQ